MVKEKVDEKEIDKKIKEYNEKHKVAHAPRVFTPEQAKNTTLQDGDVIVDAVSS